MTSANSHEYVLYGRRLISRNFFYFALLFGSAILILPQMTSAAWTQFRGNAQHSSRAETTGPRTNDIASSFVFPDKASDSWGPAVMDRENAIYVPARIGAANNNYEIFRLARDSTLSWTSDGNCCGNVFSAVNPATGAYPYVDREGILHARKPDGTDAYAFPFLHSSFSNKSALLAMDDSGTIFISHQGSTSSTRVFLSAVALVSAAR